MVIRRLAPVLVSCIALASGHACIGDTTTVDCGNGLRCPTGTSCAANQAACISDSCGNAIVERAAGEVCDDGNISDGDGCSGDCRVLENCGDNTLDDGEACDDGNDVYGDGCTPDCVSNETCGNGYRDLDEVCDDGNTESEDGCSADCLVLENCGNGLRDPGETCDDGNMVSGDGCSSNCGTEICGNRIQDVNEDCDTAGASAMCDADCTEVMCGDGTLNLPAGESCDEDPDMDGIADNTLTCDSDCSFPMCGDGLHNPAATVVGALHTEQCDWGTLNSDTEPNACRTDCRTPYCGDTVVDDMFSEDCDEGVATDTPTCDFDCSTAECGDGHRNEMHINPVTGMPEECDAVLGNDDTTPDACRTTCLSAYCGDNVVDEGEECDGGDGSDPFTPLGEPAIDVNGCNFDCTIATCGDGYLNEANIVPETGALEQCDDGVMNDDMMADACRTNCLTAHCGDSIMDSGEDCDPGEDPANNDPTDGVAMDTMTCDQDCTTALCGDGYHNSVAGEQCDDGINGTPTDSAMCDQDCTVADCGDGYINSAANEECEDGNNNNRDNCTMCRNPRCGDGYHNGSEVCDSTDPMDNGCPQGAPTCINNCTQCVL